MPALAGLDPHHVHGGREAGLQLTNGALIQIYYVDVLLYCFKKMFLEIVPNIGKNLKLTDLFTNC